MWDTKTLATIKSIDVDGGPDGILFDPFNARVYVFSHWAPNATVINAADGSIAGTIDVKNHVLFAACHEPALMAILSSVDGRSITILTDREWSGWGDV